MQSLSASIHVKRADMEERETRPALFGGVVLFVGAALIVVAAGLFTYGVYIWARTGTWPEYSAMTMLSEVGMAPRLGWGAGQRALDWLLAFSACTLLFVFGLLIAALGGWLIARHDRRQRLALDETSTASA